MTNINGDYQNRENRECAVNTVVAAGSDVKELANRIEMFAQNLRTQFVIATHSPFFLSLKEARIYDLDSRPVAVRQWYELPNMYTYFTLFEQKREQFKEKHHE